MGVALQNTARRIADRVEVDDADAEAGAAPNGALIQTSDTSESLIEVITSTVLPDSWQESGGPTFTVDGSSVKGARNGVAITRVTLKDGESKDLEIKIAAK